MTRSKSNKAIVRFFQDDHGNWVIAQFPNVLISAWAVLLIANLFLRNQHVRHLQDAVLFAWAYLELTEGKSNFRKTLGAVVLIVAVVSFFM